MLRKVRFTQGYVHTQLATTLHKYWVARNIIVWLQEDFSSPISQITNLQRCQLLFRALKHDLSKYRWDEAKVFAQNVHKLKQVKYGGEDYQRLLSEVRPALDKHYQRNRHHPEWHANGIADMSFVDKVEMIADWAASCRRNNGGNLQTSLSKNAQRFAISWPEQMRLQTLATQMQG